MTEEQRRFEPIISYLGISNHTTYACPWPTYTNLPLDPLKQERVRATREHSIPPISLYHKTRFTPSIATKIIKLLFVKIDLLIP